MLKNYFKIAFRNLLKNKVYSFINISGLAIGMAATMLIGFWIYDELNYNSYYEDQDTIAQVFQHQSFNNNISTGPAIPRPLEFALREEHDDNFEHIIMSTWNFSAYLGYGKKTINIQGYYMQQAAPEMFDLNILQGEKNGLKDTNSIMLNETTAKALFGDDDPLGKIIKVNSLNPVTVTAIYEDFPENNYFNSMNYLMPWDFYLNSEEWARNSEDQWGNNSFQMFAQIKGNTTIEAVTEKIIDIKKKNAPDAVEFDPKIFLFPMKDWYLRADWENGVQTGGRIENVWLFAIIGTFILLLACINFINLSTARSEKRATEVGIRKSIGSQRGQLVFQFLTESFLIVCFAFVLAVGIVLLSLNGFNNLASKTIEFPWANAAFWLLSLVFILITALLSGSYPALYLSSFNPVAVLKGTFKAGRYSALPRKVLVVAQFTISAALIIGTLVVMNQIQYSKDRPSGYDKDGLVQIPVFGVEFTGKHDLMREQFIASGGAVDMSTSSSPTTQVWSNRDGFTWDGKPEDLQEDFAFTYVNYDFVNTLGLNVIDGRGFSREFATDSNAVIINKTAVKYMQIQDPVGKFIRAENPESEMEPMKIIGVVDDMVVRSPYEPVKQAVYAFDGYGNISYYNLRLNPKNSVSQNLELIEQTFTANFPNVPFDYQFVDEEYARKFRSEERTASLAKVFTLLAIFISCLGLFGLASFVAEQRTKEIGVRKVLGASISQLWLLLSKDFITLVGIALVIASPLAYYLMSGWLQKFPYRTALGWDVFVIACVGALIITLIIISFQAIKAATSNPVKSLRTE